MFMNGRWVLVGLLLFVLIVPVHADSKWIEMFGGRWANYTIGVKIQGTPVWMKGAVVDAMMVWNQAQKWFAQKYFPDGKTYTLVASDAVNTPVAVRFQNISQGVSYCTLGQDTVPFRSGTTITSALMKLTGYCQNQALDRTLVYLVAIHEFGHALGIGHVNFETPHDVMREWFEPDWQISTLDLYAIHVLASGSAPSDVVVLPNSIPFDLVPFSAIPEFPTTIIVLVLPMLLVAILLRRKHFWNFDFSLG